jgi:hypothetical protein
MKGILVTDVLPNSVSFVNCAGALCELDGSQVRWCLPQLLTGESRDLYLGVVVQNEVRESLVNALCGV